MRRAFDYHEVILCFREMGSLEDNISGLRTGIARHSREPGLIYASPMMSGVIVWTYLILLVGCGSCTIGK